jgi:hypothetical protein
MPQAPYRSRRTQPDEEANLTARRSGKGLAQRHEPCVLGARQPLQLTYVGPLEIAKVRDGAAERGQTKAQSGAQDPQCGGGADPRAPTRILLRGNPNPSVCRLHYVDAEKRVGEGRLVDDSKRRQDIRQAIARGALPSRQPGRVWGGSGSGAECVLCGEHVTAQETELELEFPADSGNAVASYLVHVQCFSVWEAERESAPKGLPDGSDRGTMPDRERDRTQRRGSG